MKLLIQNTHIHSLSCKHTHSPQRNTRAVFQAKFYMVPRIMLQVWQSSTRTHRQVNFTRPFFSPALYICYWAKQPCFVHTESRFFFFNVRYDLLLLHSLTAAGTKDVYMGIFYFFFSLKLCRKFCVQFMQTDRLKCSQFGAICTTNTLKPGRIAACWI